MTPKHDDINRGSSRPERSAFKGALGPGERRDF